MTFSVPVNAVDVVTGDGLLFPTNTFEDVIGYTHVGTLPQSQQLVAEHQTSSKLLQRGYNIAPRFKSSAKYYRETNYYDRTVQLVLPLPDWLTDMECSVARITMQLSVPTEEIAEIKANDPASWVLTFDVGKWGTVLPIVSQYYAGALDRPHKWLIGIALTLAAAGRAAKNMVVLKIKFQQSALPSGVNMDMVYDAGVDSSITKYNLRELR